MNRNEFWYIAFANRNYLSPQDTVLRERPVYLREQGEGVAVAVAGKN